MSWNNSARARRRQPIHGEAGGIGKGAAESYDRLEFLFWR